MEVQDVKVIVGNCSKGTMCYEIEHYRHWPLSLERYYVKATSFQQFVERAKLLPDLCNVSNCCLLERVHTNWFKHPSDYYNIETVNNYTIKRY